MKEIGQYFIGRERKNEDYRAYLSKELPSRETLARYEPKAEWFANPKLAYGSQHDIGHLTRVLVLQELLANNVHEQNPDLNLDREALRWSAVTHDVRKAGEYELNFSLHGVKAAEWIEKQFSLMHPEVPIDTLRRVSSLNYYHGFNNRRVPEPFPEELKILKDADAADILRLVHGHSLVSKVPVS